ncbi:MAG: hypothetical protein JNL67_22090 [Planctomycetaceae bacterium]|nr:hypothetical protein [Planctomycetaceae bacterium]
MSKHKYWLQLAAFLLAITVAAIVGRESQAEEPVPTLRWKFQPGQVYRFDITQSSSTTEIDVAGNKILQPESRRLQIRWEVLAATPELIEVEMRYSEIEMELGTPAGKVAASTRPDFPQTGTGKAGNLLRLLLQRLQPLIDQPIKLQVEPTGKVRQVELPAELLAHITTAAETRPLRAAVSLTGIQDLLGSFLTPFPTEPAADWQHQSTYEVAAGVPLTRNTKYKLGPWSEAETNIEITYTSELSFPEQFLIGPRQPHDPEASQAKDPNPPRGAAPPFDFDTVAVKWPRIALQDCNGRLVFDVKEGYVREATGRTTLTTEKSYSDTKIKTTISTQTEVKIQRN